MKLHAGKIYHLGIGKSEARSNLSKANKQRDLYGSSSEPSLFDNINF